MEMPCEESLHRIRFFLYVLKFLLHYLKNSHQVTMYSQNSQHLVLVLLCHVMHFQGSRMDDQRCSLSQIRTPETQCSAMNEKSAPGSGPARSASFRPSSDIGWPKNKDQKSPKQVHDKAEISTPGSPLDRQHLYLRGFSSPPICVCMSYKFLIIDLLLSL